MNGHVLKKRLSTGPVPDPFPEIRQLAALPIDEIYFCKMSHSCWHLIRFFFPKTKIQVLICDALNLPYRDESFDAALSIAVIQ